jgi:poly(3-hydroxybutyrate) depolymerase
VLCLVLVHLCLAAFAAAATASDFLAATLPKTGAEPNDLPYRYLVPAGYNPANAYPLIIFLHGSGERGNDNNAQLNNNANGALQLVSDANQAISPCFMLAPQASFNEGWNANTLGQVVRAAQQLAATYSIDSERIYVTGLSMGGAGSWQIVTLYPFYFAAAVPMSGWGAGYYEKIVSLPIWNFHAADDGNVNVSGSDNTVSALRLLGGRVIYTRYATGGHQIWPTAYATPSLRPWMLTQRRNQPMAGTPVISIASPASHLVPPAIVTTRTVSGSASIPGGIAQVYWTFTPWVGGAGVDTSPYSLANGTETWSVSNAAVTETSTLFLAVATGSTWSSLGGVTTLNDYFWNIPTGANLTAPTLAIATPSATGTFNTTSAFLNLTGTAAAAGGKTLKAITWSNDRGGEGIGLGTTAWNIDGIEVQSGDNLLTITVRDSSSVTASTTLLVHASLSGDTTGPSVPTNLAATATSPTTVALTWTASTDNVGVTGYGIYRNGALTGTSPSPSYTDTGLTASTAYSYSISAYDAAHNLSGRTAAVSVTTLAAPAITTQPQALTTVNLGASFALSVTATGTDLTYVWRKDGIAIAGAPSQPAYTVASMASTNAGTYTVVVSNSGGSVTSDNAVVQLAGSSSSSSGSSSGSGSSSSGSSGSSTSSSSSSSSSSGSSSSGGGGGAPETWVLAFLSAAALARVAARSAHKLR